MGHQKEDNPNTDWLLFYYWVRGDSNPGCMGEQFREAE